MSRPIKPGPAPTWELPHGKGQGPQPSQTLPPLKLAKKKSKYNNQSPPSANA